MEPQTLRKTKCLTRVNHLHVFFRKMLVQFSCAASVPRIDPHPRYAAFQPEAQLIRFGSRGTLPLCGSAAAPVCIAFLNGTKWSKQEVMNTK